MTNLRESPSGKPIEGISTGQVLTWDQVLQAWAAGAGASSILDGGNTWTGDNTWEGNQALFNGEFFFVDVTGEVDIHSDGILGINSGSTLNIISSASANLATTGTTLTLQAQTTWNGFSVTADVNLQAATSLRLFTNSTERLEILANGSWQLNNVLGAVTQVLENSGPTTPPAWAGPRSITLSITVPAIAAGSVGYVNTSLAATALAGLLTTNDAVEVNPQSDLVAAGAGGGYINARISAADTLRTAFLGPLAGGAANFTVTKVR